MTSLRATGAAGLVVSFTAIAAIYCLRAPPPQAGAAARSSAIPATAVATANRASRFGLLPLHFEPLAEPGHALARGPDYAMLLAPRATTLRLLGSTRESQLTMSLVGGRASSVLPEQPLPGVSNYLLGNDPNSWRIGVRQFARVRQRQVYPGIDLVHYGRGRELEYDFVVAPGANPDDIRIAYDGAEAMHVDSDGNLRIAVGDGEVTHRKPVLYQQLDDGSRRFIDGAFRLVAQAAGRLAHVAFDIGRYDRKRTLVIDPVLSYATFLGGTSGNELINDIAVDSAGAVYVAGATNSANFPVTSGASQTTLGGGSDVFVAKLNPAGTALEYSTFVGGTGVDQAYAVRIAGGTAYVAGETTSANFPTVGPAAQPTYGGSRDVFVLRLNAQGTALLYSTYLGGSGGEPKSIGTTGFGIDANGNAYVSGVTESTNYPVSAGAPQTTRGNPNSAQFDSDMFLSKLNAAGTTLLFSSYHGGSSIEDPGYDSLVQPKPLAIDGNGNAWLVSSTRSNDMPVTANAFDSSFNGTPGTTQDVLVVRFNTVAGARSYSSYFGSSADDFGISVAIDANGDAYFVGQAGGAAFPATTGAFDTTYNGGASDAFVAKVAATSGALAYSTFLGGGLIERPVQIRVDGGGNAFVAGEARAGFPTTAGAPDTTVNGSSDGFVAKLNAAGTALLYSTFVGSSDGESVFGLEVDAAGNAYGILSGTTAGDAPVTTGGRAYVAGTDEWLFKLNASGTAFLDAGYLGGSADDYGTAIAIDNQENLYLAGVTGSANFPVTAGAFQTTKAGSGTAEDTFIAKFATTPGAPVSQPGTLQFNTNAFTVAENGATATISVTRAGGTTGAVSVQYATANNTATAGTDYTSASGTLNWADGDSNPKTFTVAITDDNAVEGPETVNLALSFATGGATLGSPATAVLTINDNDIAAPGITLSATALNFGSINVGATSTAQSSTLTNNGNANLVIGTVTKTGANAAEFNVTTDSCSGQTLAPNGTCALTVTFAPAAGGARVAALAIPSSAPGSPTAVSLAGTGVVPQAQPGSIQFSAASFSGNENGGSVTLTLTRTAGTDGAVGVSVTSGGGSASAGADYGALSTTVTWPAGDGAARTVTLALLDDAIDEPDETVTVALANPTGGAALGSPASATVTIVDNDAPPTQTVSVEGKYGGGSLQQRDLLVLALLVLAGVAARRRTRRESIRRALPSVVFAATSLPIIGQAADNPGWYVDVAAGQARSSLSAKEIERGLAALGYAATVNADDNRFSGSIDFGYQFARGLDLSVSMVSLGEYDVRVSTTTVNVDQLLADTARIVGNGGRGLRLGAGWRIALGQSWSLTPRVGAIRWDSDTKLSAGGTSLRRSDDSLDFTAGVQLGRDFARATVCLRLDRYRVGSRNDIDTLLLGVRYRLGH
jgi:hypothetical protein